MICRRLQKTESPALLMGRNPALDFRGRTMIIKMPGQGPQVKRGPRPWGQLLVRELVLQRTIRQEQRTGGKLEADLLGPLTIVKLEGKRADLVSQKGKRKIKINIDHLIHYVQPEERVPAKLRTVLVSSPLAGPSQTSTQQTHTHTHAHTFAGTPACQKALRPSQDTEHCE